MLPVDHDFGLRDSTSIDEYPGPGEQMPRLPAQAKGRVPVTLTAG